MTKKDPYSSCAICRFMRALAFSAIGAGITGYTAKWLGMEQNNVIIVAFFGALGAVMWASRKREE
jgi:uncharacterized membrane protein YfcA